MSNPAPAQSAIAGAEEAARALVALFSAEDAGRGHIVDVLIEQRAKRLRARPIAWQAVRSLLFPVLRYRRAVALADAIRDLSGHGIFRHVSDLLRLDLAIEGAEHIPSKGGAILIANHPTGLADGIAVYDALIRQRTDIAFFANSDALRVAPGFLDIVIPVEWVLAKRTMAKTKAMMRRAELSFSRDELVVMFPSGRLAHFTKAGLRDKDWYPTTITFMRRYGVPLLPLHITARNSWLYYALAASHAELRDITLFNETLNKARSRFALRFGPLIAPETVSGDPDTAIRRLKHHVEEELPRGLPWTG